MNMIETALRYRDVLGLSVVPQKNKQPLVPWIEFQTRKATEEEIREWWTKWPDAGISAVTGSISGVVVIDCDSQEAIDFFERSIPDSLVVPYSETPRGGRHYFFSSDEKLSKQVGLFHKIDFQAEKSCIVLPPSQGLNGRGYQWVIEPSSRQSFPDFRAAMPPPIIKKINSTIYKGEVTTDGKTPTVGLLHPVTFSLEKGNRDESLYYLANGMIKGGIDPQVVKITLNYVAKNCKPPLSEQEIDAKIASALERAARKERNISAEVSNFVAVTSGIFSVTSCYTGLQAVTKEEKGAIRIALMRLYKAGLIEKVGKNDGHYRRIETDLNFITFDDTEEVPFPVQLPFALHDMVEISAGNIILIGGEFNSGKSTACIEILRMNKNRVPIRYISSEVSTQSEFKKRFRGYRGIPLSFWMPDEMTDYVSQSSDFAHSLKPGALNIIDYLEFSEGDFTTGAEALRQIHDKLDGGVAVVAVQKKKGSRLPRSGDLIMEKPRLAITLSSLDDGTGIAEIVKAKICKGGKHDGKKLKFEIVEHGSTFKTLNDWGFLRF